MMQCRRLQTSDIAPRRKTACCKWHAGFSSSAGRTPKRFHQVLTMEAPIRPSRVHSTVESQPGVDASLHLCIRCIAWEKRGSGRWRPRLGFPRAGLAFEQRCDATSLVNPAVAQPLHFPFSPSSRVLAEALKKKKKLHPSDDQQTASQDETDRQKLSWKRDHPVPPSFLGPSG